MDGREHPPLEELNPTYFGHSIGHWEGDTLVVDTIGYNEKTWIDFNGHPKTGQLHTIEYFSRPYKEVLHYEAVIDDPGAYSEPWRVAWDINWIEGQELQDYICQENNKFLLDLTDDYGEPFFEKSSGLEQDFKKFTLMRPGKPVYRLPRAHPDHQTTALRTAPVRCP